MTRTPAKPRSARSGKSSPPGDNRLLAPEQIRAKAYEIYALRVDRGTPGDAVSDWLRAENELRAEETTSVPGTRRSKRSK
jgi:hypothetical protein